ncbi:hypothetical protein [Pseudoalteromonas sp. Of7M-16]|uniref:hypothetical protein n=1 Tax=Pseudoalteromonas sp. Of7M-16 TaxID=2917756 RepID=UPI001EF53CE4|nr:hypothetical protein [Pseudoalteromonas sp. Of7M-16]MCG7548588.1 hypothetical protein [Pseudoalteromonas sp. Of7M-16]
MTHPVKWFSSKMEGAPILTSGYNAEDCGSLAALLKTVLTLGFGSKPVDSLVYDAAKAEAKATFQAGHSYLQHQIIKVEGATDNTYNGEFRVSAVSSTEVWFKLTAVPAGDALGTITMSIPPAGWKVKAESSNGHIIVFEPGRDVGNVMLRVDNSDFPNPNGSNTSTNNNTGARGTSSSYRAIKARVESVSSYTDIDMYDAEIEQRWPASHVYATEPEWEIISDDAFFYFIIKYARSSCKAVFFAGYINSVRPGDRYCFLLNGLSYWSQNTTTGAWSNTSWSAYNFGLRFNTPYSKNLISRGHHQLFGTETVIFTNNMDYSGSLLSHPNPADNGFYINNQPVMVCENENTYRGSLPGLLTPLSGSVSYDNKTLSELPTMPNNTVRCHMLVISDSATWSGGTNSRPYLHCFDVSDSGWRA